MSKCPMYVVEARTKSGALDPGAAQPPFNVASERQLFEYYSDNSGRVAYQGEPEHYELVVGRFASHGWAVRPKTW